MIAASFLQFPANCLSVKLLVSLIVLDLAGSGCKYAAECVACCMLASVVCSIKWNLEN
jgi:hypothetical protein